MNEKQKKFRNEYAVTTPKSPKFDPNEAAQDISREQLREFAELVRGTPNEDFIALKDPKVQELIQYIMAAIILENERLNAPDGFPIQIYSRYKADQSLKDKIDKFAQMKDGEPTQVTDYLGFKIIPEAQHTVFYSDGDPKLQRLIEKRERTRHFMTDMYQFLAEHPTMTFEEYTKKCTEVLKELFKCYPKEATSRRKFYKSRISLINADLEMYNRMVEESDEKMTLEEIARLTNINIKTLLTLLRNSYANEATLYKLRKDLMRTFEESDLLKSLGITVSDDPERTKRKSTANGYRSEFVGLNLCIPTDLTDTEMQLPTLEIPIECQIQTMEQYRDGNIGFAAHTKLPNKSFKLKPIPAVGTGMRYKDPQGTLAYCREFLSHIMHISPQCAIAKATGNDFEDERIMITQFDLYEAFRLISRVDPDSFAFRAYNKYLTELYQKREELLPAGESLLPEYIRFADIPNPTRDNAEYCEFFQELRESLTQTIDTSLGVEGPAIESDELEATIEDNGSAKKPPEDIEL